MKFRNYLQPNSIEEALELAKAKDSAILGGMMWMRMQQKEVENAIDLSLLGLDKIEETDEGIRIGAYVTLRQAETSELLNSYTYGRITEMFAPIVGVQFRNTATIGGSIFGRFGFSDVTTLFTSLSAKVVFAGRGVLPIEQFIKEKAILNDILLYIIIPKGKPDSVITMAHRNSATDFPVITTALCKRNGIVRFAVSPAPIRASFIETKEENAAALLTLLNDEMTFAGDRTNSKEYRAHLAFVLLKRSLLKMGVTL